ncbi:hypothetical protein [Arthrobacter glacialis]|uniref:Uncharacterized protein n=1 Tax=Arthrobacter glacialis TaxID=1664 RepID=A0A2S3ZT64_ARTGL|nr:hypothetical protein [Arthrobacter glacialis]POH72408.1 hypothetical protein CVS27_16115 [Arthrobacter glacialis]
MPSSSVSASSLDSEISPHAKGTTLKFECNNPIGAGLTAADLGAGTEKPGVPEVLYINTTSTGTGPNQWGDGVTSDGLQFQKMGLVMKAGTAFTLSVPTEKRGRTKIGWSNSGYTLADELVIPGCTSAQANANWIVYPGGFWLKEPGGVPLEATTDQTTQTIYSPIGKTCS